MRVGRETKIWRDWVFDDRKHALVIEFEVETLADLSGYALAMKIYLEARNLEIFVPLPLIKGVKTPIYFEFLDGDKLEGWLEWQTSDMSLTGYSEQISSSLFLYSAARHQTWHYEGYLIGFGDHFPSPEPTPAPYPYPDPNPNPLPDPIPNEAFDLNIAQAQLSSHELFPYIYIQPWPSISQYDLEASFIQAPASVTTGNNFWTKLAGDKTAAKRDEMLQDAVDFIDATINPNSNQTDTGQFVVAVSDLQSVLCCYLKVWRELTSLDYVSFEALTIVVDRELGGWEALQQDIADPAYSTDLVNIWNSLFALNICLGYRHTLMRHLLCILSTNQLLNFTLTYVVEKKERPVHNNAEVVSAEILVYEPSPYEIKQRLDSTLVLPPEIFPLPPTTSSTTPTTPPTTWIKPYAIGAARSIQHELIGYELGEIQKIENILRGELRENTNRQLQRKISENTEVLSDINDHNLERGANSTDLISQVQKTLSEHKTTTAMDSYKADYGMPTTQTMTVSGGWTVDENPAGGFEKNVSRFARDIIDKTVKRISRQVSYTRGLLEFEENEVMDSAKFDNVSGEGNIRGIYQWVNKTYRVYARNLENRLVLEIMLDDPAAFFIKNLKTYFDLEMTPPTSPQTNGLKTYSDILDAAPASDKKSGKKPVEGTTVDLYYLDLFELYDVAEALPPPLQIITVSGTIKSKNPISETFLDVPPGYSATSATVSVVSYDDTATITAFIATDAITVTTAKPGSVDLSGNFQTIHVSILCKPVTPPGNGAGEGDDTGGDSDEFTNFYVANIEILCTRTAELLADWQYQAYQKIEAGYQQQIAAYQVALAGQKQALSEANPSFLDDIINNQIIQGCLALFYANYLTLVGTDEAGGSTADDPSPSQQVISQPRYFEYCRNALSWTDLDCQLFFGAASDQSMEEGQNVLLRAFSPDLNFRNFLRAKKARILVPVKWDFTRSFLYFLHSGGIWPSGENFTPTLQDDIEINNKIKIEAAVSRYPERETESWVIQAPTAMTMLHDSHQLPRYRREI